MTVKSADTRTDAMTAPIVHGGTNVPVAGSSVTTHLLDATVTELTTPFA